MTKDQAANLNMDKTTLAVLKKPENAAFVASIPILADFITELEDNIDAQESYGETQENAGDGVPEDKEIKRTKACRLASTMAGLMYSFATNTGNTILAGQMKITFSELSKTKDAQLADRCRFIHATATTNQVAATPYAVTVGRLNALDAAIIAWEAKSTANRDADVVIKAATEGLLTTQKATAVLLNDKIDPLIEVFVEDEPDFYNEYQAAREVIDPATQHTKAAGLVTINGIGTPVAGATITAVKADDPTKIFTATSAVDGSFNVLIPKPGIYTITVTKDGYQTLQITNVEIKLGQTTTLNVQLIPAP
jgi:hypothetical protein